LRALLADDHAIVRRGLRSLLEEAGHSVVAEAADGLEAVQLAEEHQPGSSEGS
jgi:response regulator NasT